MHNYLPRIYYFIDKFDPNHFNKLDKNIALIYRNYDKKNNKELIKKIKFYCKKKRRKFIISNNYKLALKLDLDGVYFPSFIADKKHKNFPKKKNFIILGSAHNIKEIRLKEEQDVQCIFISSLFKKNSNYLGMNKFKNLINNTKKRIIALGGINDSNIKKTFNLKIYGFAAIGLFNNKKKRPHNFLGAVNKLSFSF